jgi:hypothetical protein
MTIGAALPIQLGLPGGVAGWKLLQAKAPTDFKSLTSNPGLQRDLAYLREKLPLADTPAKLLDDPRIRDMVMDAYGLSAQAELAALMKQVLASDPDDKTSTAYRMTDSRYRILARDFNYGVPGTEAVPALASTATFTIDGLSETDFLLRFSGTFGGVKVTETPISGARTRGELAKAIEKAFQAADGGNKDITVSLVGTRIVLNDAKGRGKASDFAFYTATMPGEANSVTVKQIGTTAGSKAIAATGGPAVKNPAFVEQVVAKLTQARFEEAIGNNSETLRKAVYTKRNLPNITNWYSVIADRPLAEVIQKALGLPDSFGQVDVDKQVGILEKRFPIADLKDPAKLGKLLDRFVALGTSDEAAAWSQGAGIASLFSPLGSTTTASGINLSGLNMAALFRATS